VGTLVIVVEKFETITQGGQVHLPIGLEGEIKTVDEDGDLLVTFKGGAGDQWVSQPDEDKLVGIGKASPTPAPIPAPCEAGEDCVPAWLKPNKPKEQPGEKPSKRLHQPEALSAGLHVTVTVNFDSNNAKDPVHLEVGQEGVVESMDGDGNALVRFDNFDHQWVHHSNFNKLKAHGKDPSPDAGVAVPEPTPETVPPPCAAGDHACERRETHGTGRKAHQKQQEAAANRQPAGRRATSGALKVGMTVVATESFSTINQKEPHVIIVGQEGIVEKVDSDGDAFIKFKGVSPNQWVAKANHIKMTAVQKASEHSTRHSTTLQGAGARSSAHLPVAEHVPPELLLTSPTHESHAAGTYELVEDVRANGLPIWRKKNGLTVLYSGNNGRWHIGGKDQIQKAFNCNEGFLWLPEWNDGKLPHRTPGIWKHSEGGGWHDDQAIKIEAIEEEDVVLGHEMKAGEIFGVGDTVVVKGRRGKVKWDGRELGHQFATLKWEDDGSESDIIHVLKIKAAFGMSVAQHFAASSRKHAIVAKATETNKPILVIHAPSAGCGESCAEFVKSVNSGSRAHHLLSMFVVAFCDDSCVDWAVAGHTYIPSAHFFKPDGTALQIPGPDPKRPHFFKDEVSLWHAMLSALQQVGGPKMDEHFEADISQHFLQTPAVTKEQICERAKAAGKPIMVIISSQWCSACLVLRGSVNTGQEVRALLPSFTVVYAEDGWGNQWRQEGHEYIPQVNFFRPDCTTRLPAFASSNFRYFFSDDARLAAGMRLAIQAGARPLRESPFDQDIAELLLETDDREAAFAAAAAAGKPLMVLITQPWCSICAGLIRSVNAGSGVRNLLPSFTTLHISKEEKVSQWMELMENYIPQAYFFNPDGTAINIQGPLFKFKRYFEKDNGLADAMRLALGGDEEL
jgi:hypothetical protein